MDRGCPDSTAEEQSTASLDCGGVRNVGSSAGPSADQSQKWLASAHWVWQVRFNPEHDQLLLTSSSDSFVNLLHLPSLAARLPTEQPKYSSRNNAAKDGCAASFDMHEDSVHGKKILPTYFYSQTVGLN